MNRFLVLLVVLALVLGLAAARSQPKKNKGKNKEGGRREGKVGNTDTTWVWGECVPNQGPCGSGQKTGSCTGELCEVPTKTADCRVKCPREEAAAEAPVEGDGEEAVATAAPARGGGKGGKGGRRPGKGGKGKTQENNNDNNSNGTGNGRREKPQRGGRKPNKGDKPAKAKECHYARATESECDPITNRLNKTRVLKGSPTPECPEVRVESVSCDRNAIKKENRRCNYTKGAFGPCNETTNRRTREDTLFDPTMASEECRLVRIIEDKCDCKYNWEQAEACNETTNTFNITGSLVVVEGAPDNCEVVRTHTHMCKRGKVPCSFGEWGEFGECSKGIQTRTRELQKGPRHMCNRLTREMTICE